MSGGKLEWSGQMAFDRDVLALRKLPANRPGEGQYLEIERHEIPQLLEVIRKVFGEEVFADIPTVVSNQKPWLDELLGG